MWIWRRQAVEFEQLLGWAEARDMQMEDPGLWVGGNSRPKVYGCSIWVTKMCDQEAAMGGFYLCSLSDTIKS